MNFPEISIIVPVYNVENYLTRCLDSIIAQSFDNYLLILINDGSSDNSGKICDEYLKKDNRIKVIHQTNKGSGIARNVGISESQGNYIAFIDADDYIDKDYLSTMYYFAIRDNADMVISSFYRENMKTTEIIKNKPSSLLNKEIAIDFINNKLHAGLWNKLIKRDFIIKNKILFPKDSYYEDMHFTISLLMNGSKVTYLDKPTYHYVTNPNSLTFNININKRKKAFKEFARNMQDLIIRFNLKDDIYFAYSINRLININKKKFVIKFYSSRNDINEILNYIPSVFKIKDIKCFSDIAYYIAIKYDVYILFYFRNLIKRLINFSIK